MKYHGTNFSLLKDDEQRQTAVYWCQPINMTEVKLESHDGHQYSFKTRMLAGLMVTHMVQDEG